MAGTPCQLNGGDINSGVMYKFRRYRSNLCYILAATINHVDTYIVNNPDGG